MCCILCDLIKCSCSRMIAYLLQVGMISLAIAQLTHPNEWSYMALFKNSTIVTESIKKAVEEAIVDAIPFYKGGTTTIAPNSTITIGVESRVDIVFWCFLLIGVNLVGFFALFFECFTIVMAYTLIVLGYFFAAFSHLRQTGNYWYVLDIIVFGIILLNCVLELIFKFCSECCSEICGCKKEKSLASGPMFKQNVNAVPPPPSFIEEADPQPFF